MTQLDHPQSAGQQAPVTDPLPDLNALLWRGINPLRRKAEAPLIAQIAAVMADAGKGRLPVFDTTAARLSDWIVGRFAHIAALDRINREHSIRVATAPDEPARRLLVLDFARALGASGRQIAGDRKAFRRWFGLDTVMERYRRQIAMAEREAAFGLGRLGVMVAALLGQAPYDAAGIWRRSGLEAAVIAALAYPGDARVRTAAFECLSALLAAVPAPARDTLPGEIVLRRIHADATSRTSEVATQIAALDALFLLSEPDFMLAVRARLAVPGKGDDLWLRRHAVGLLCQVSDTLPEAGPVLETVCNDPSAAVRQALARGLDHLPPALAASLLDRLATDSATEVRAQALDRIPALMGRLPEARLAGRLAQSLQGEADDFVLRTALDAAARGAESLGAWSGPEWTPLRPVIEDLHRTAAAIPVRRWAGHALERIWCASEPEAASLRTFLTDRLRGSAEGGTRRLTAVRQLAMERPDLLARVLAVMAQDDYGYELLGTSHALGPRVRRGDLFRFRTWRALYEFRHPSPDKRQAYSHTIGRIFRGLWHAPSSIMAELAQTRVPGEPLFISGEGGWRPYLPLPDHALSAIDTGDTVRIVTSEGITEMTPPRGFLRRLRSRVQLSLRFAEIAALRNWTEARNQPPTAYVAALRDLGFEIRLRPHSDRAGTDPAAARFFSVGWPLLLPSEIWQQFGSYFYTLHQNTLRHLSIFIGAVLLWFLGKHLWVSARMRRTRARLPLVLGGWGTRGKSGTERIKAALISALGYSLVSKTTGNEAMFLYGFPFGPVKEMFLFRPYDKATIWEQEDVARLATKLKGDVFLWECMGLTPAYVKVLQRHWMRDDISTVTNTYPDHEDLQGPAGRDIPMVMTNFIPKNGRLLTSEEQMRPILADAAAALGTSMAGVGWKEAGMLPAEALTRFPYEEHPYNIALVLKLAEDLGIGADFALREMADRVVPDIGVLKAYPLAAMRGRQIEFVMGNSANERFGAMGNWRRMGFSTQDPYADPGVMLTAVVNNRADRVPRSRVFADLLVNDVSLDRIVLIGSNLQGMQGYIDEAVEARLRELSLFSGTTPDQTPTALLEQAARGLRVAYRDTDIQDRIRAMASGLAPAAAPAINAQPDAAGILGLLRGLADLPGERVEDLALRQAELETERAEYRTLDERIVRGDPPAAVDDAFREAFRIWFRRKLVVVEDYHASGDKVIDIVCSATPPGLHNRVMGMQNIKGTGLDFVYRWQAWETVHNACDRAEDANPLISDDGLQTLVSFQEYGVASEERVRATLHLLRSRDGEMLKSQLDLIAAALDAQLAQVRRGMSVDRKQSGWDRVFQYAEAFLDAGDAVRRRKVADRIYRDMITQRISHERAARELKSLNSRQKGGWLAEALSAFAKRKKTGPEPSADPAGK